MKLYRAGVAVGVLAAVAALAACSSSGSSSSGSTTPAGGSSSTSTSSSTASGSCPSGSLKSEGSTAQANAMNAWINGFAKACSSAKVNYNPTGSGDGVSAFTAGQVDFAGSDSALSPDKGEVKAATTQCKSPALDLPMVVGPIALGYKLSGVSKLVLTPELIAKIFTGKIKTWNDAAITAKNPGTTLPSTKISVVYRSDSSGTTANFENFLSATDKADFTAEPAKDNTAKVFPGGQGAAKSQGVAAAIGSTEGSIGYVEYSFAVSASLQTASVDSGSGAVAVSPANASKAIGDAQVVGTGDDVSLKINYATKAAGAYPIILATYEIVCTKYSDSAIGALVKAFLTYTAGPGQAALPQLGYAPLPASLLTKVQASIAKIS